MVVDDSGWQEMMDGQLLYFDTEANKLERLSL
jgi:hypothetical protein